MSPEAKRDRLLEASAVLLDAAGRRLNTVALNQALFYLDLACLRDLGEPFTQNGYIALEQGPVIAKYQKNLMAALRDPGIARQGDAGMAKPVVLRKLPRSQVMTPSVRSLALLISRWCAPMLTTELSDFSRENPGWIIAYEGAKAAGTSRPVIDLNIAMQQIVDADPWIDEPIDEATKLACKSADNAKGMPW